MIKNQEIEINKYKNIYFYLRDTILIFVAILFIFFIFNNPQISVNGVSKGLYICGNVIIPSLFPFIVLCNFISLSPMVKVISKILLPITQNIFNLPANVGYIVFISFIGGYPMGAKLISEALKKEEIDVNMANRLLCFCINAGPAFVITAIGYIGYGSKKIGVYLLISHLLGSITIGIILGIIGKFSNSKIVNVTEYKYLKYSEAFVRSVSDGGNAILNISCFVIIFSVITEIIKSKIRNNIFNNILLSFLELTVSMNDVVSLNGMTSFLMCSFLISFSGISVIFQIFYFIKDYNVNKKNLFIFRIIHGFISAFFMYLILILFGNVIDTSGVVFKNNLQLFQLSPFISTTIFVLSLSFIVCSYNEFFEKDQYY